MSVHSQRWIGIPFLRDATPFEYLIRLVVFNDTFSDDIQIEGVITDLGQIAVVTSQPVIRGRPAGQEQVRDFMEKMGFIMADCPPLGRKNVSSLSFFHPEEHLAVFDAHAANFLISEGIVAPIDALIVRPDEHLMESLEFYLSLTPQQRRRELGLHTSAVHGF